VVLLSYSVLTGILLSAVVPYFTRIFKRAAAPVLAVFPLAIFIQLCLAIPALSKGEVWNYSMAWLPRLGLRFSFYLDGWALVMAMLISGIGALVVIYGGAYLEGNPQIERFYSLIYLFMSAMLGVALSSNGLLLFVFWELTSVSSFFLIGFDHQRANARAAAWQALLVTGTGGLALLAGLVLLAQITGTFELQHWLGMAARIQNHPLAPWAFVLILLGAMTKSAQFPFHFWLPNAMEAPTPVSAYLHSATMVKAGVFLLARFFPILGGLAWWPVCLVAVGLTTLLAGSFLALAKTDLKGLLAYTTIAALGMLILLLGLGTPLSIKTAVVFMIAHAMYKGALFLVAGGVDHGAGTRNILELGGLARAMPYTALAAGLAVISMAGILPFVGFVAKELVYESTLQFSGSAWLTALVLAANVAMVAAAGWVGITPFWAKPSRHLHPHEGSTGLWLPPLILAVCGLAAGVYSTQLGKYLVAPAAQAVLFAHLQVKLSLWHGVTPMLYLSLITLLLGFLLFILRRKIQPLMISFWHKLAAMGPAVLYQRGLQGLLSFAAWQTRFLQSGYLSQYITTIILTTVGLSLLTLITKPGILQLGVFSMPRFYDVILIGIILAATIQVTRSRSRLATIALLGSIGFSIAVIFLLYSAPDLAMVQFAIETLIVILFVLIIYRLPKFSQLSGKAIHIRDALIGAAGGVLMTMLMLLVSRHESEVRLAKYFAENSVPLAKGRNIVNVILVDFRSMDTLGEITVLAIAAIGVFTLLKAVWHTNNESKEEEKG